MRKQNDFKVPEISDSKKIEIILEKQIQKKKRKKNKRKMIQKVGGSGQKKLKQLASESTTAVNELKESTKSLEKTTKSLKKSTSELKESTKSLEKSTKNLEKSTKSLEKIIDVDCVKLANEQAEIRCIIEKVRQQHKKMKEEMGAILKMLDEENEQMKKENNSLKKSKCKNKSTLNPLSYKKQIMKQDNASTTDKTSKTSANDITAMVKLGSFQSNKTVASNSKLVKNKAASENSNEVETIKPH